MIFIKFVFLSSFSYTVYDFYLIFILYLNDKIPDLVDMLLAMMS
jgi:hypothetical protein